jgi:glycosyltransferase involved in cell wall biosynthesis
VLVSDSTALDHPRHRVKESAKRALVSGLFTAAFVAGRRSAEYVADLGIKPGYIWRGVDVVDNDHFAVAAEVNSRVAPSFLAVTRLSPEKDLPTLIEAFRLYRDAGGSWDLRIAGTGPQETELRNAVSPNLIAHVHWLGWVSYEDLPGCYHSSNCLVLPSVSEPWGLVVNEAMAAGLPVLVSERCGCVPELCHEGVNGFAFNPGDAPRLADLMLAVASDRNRAREMGEASRRIIASFSIEASARAVVECVSTLLTS